MGTSVFLQKTRISYSRSYLPDGLSLKLHFVIFSITLYRGCHDAGSWVAIMETHAIHTSDR